MLVEIKDRLFLFVLSDFFDLDFGDGDSLSVFDVVSFRYLLGNSFMIDMVL